MTTSSDEITMALDELETRLDRLRSLYEQYFTGIEKAAPAVQHKDVERRIQTLRKINLRNTAQRFRFQTLIQKYTTYLQYWQRMLRRIEDGTHKRDLARAARYGSKPQARRPNDGVYELDPDAIEEVSEEFDGELVEEPPTNERPALVAPQPAAASRTPSPVAQPTQSTQPTNPRVAAQPTQSTTPIATAGRQVEVLPFDVVEAPAKTLAVPEVTRASSVPSVPTMAPASAQPAQPAKKPGLSVFGVAQKPTSAQKPLTPTATQAPAATTSPAPAPAAPVTPRPAPVASAPATPSPVARPVAPATTPSGGAPRPTSTDAALRQLYERYRDARKKNGEAEVEFDTVARQVRDTLPKLREKYPGQNVELDVSVKDGKTVLRPVIKAKK
ncbi:MAG: hypothetical protein JNK05_12055 [Myxococcales bacterium]|nr:hypothetical protein [Myxococcales bacterium]